MHLHVHFVSVVVLPLFLNSSMLCYIELYYTFQSQLLYPTTWVTMPPSTGHKGSLKGLMSMKLMFVFSFSVDENRKPKSTPVILAEIAQEEGL